MVEFKCVSGVHRPISHTIEKMAVFIITPKGDEVNIYSAIDQGLVLRVEDHYHTTHKYVKIFIQKQTVEYKLYWSWVFEFDPTKYETDIYSFSKTRGPLFFSARGRILSDDEIISSPFFSYDLKRWAKNELNKPATSTLDDLVVIHKPNPKVKLRKLGVKKEGVST